MIADRLENIGCYRTLSSNFEAAVAFLEKTDLDLLPVGQFEVKGKDVYGFVVDRTLEEEPRQWEIHKKYADIQLVLEGNERIGWCVLDEDCPSYDEDKDVAFSEDITGRDFTLGRNEFMIFFPQDVHLPNGPAGGRSRARKVILKVKMV